VNGTWLPPLALLNGCVNDAEVSTLWDAAVGRVIPGQAKIDAGVSQEASLLMFMYRQPDWLDARSTALAMRQAAFLAPLADRQAGMAAAARSCLLNQRSLARAGDACASADRAPAGTVVRHDRPKMLTQRKKGGARSATEPASRRLSTD
jgi:hypothetical protein